MALKTARISIKIFVIIVLIAFSLMVASYAIPNENVQGNIFKDAPKFFDLDQYVIPGDYATRLDIFTDALILTEVSYYRENVSLVDNAMSVYSIYNGADFENYTHGDENVIREYPRYWHGNLVVYKVLFDFFDNNAIKILNLFFEAVLIIGILKLMVEHGLKNYIVPFMLSLFLIHPEVMGLCLAFAPMFNILLISVYVMLKFKDKIFKDNNLFYYFLIVGMVTNFFDFLTFPLVSFGIPIIFYIILERDKQTLKNNIIKVILFGLMWGIGYVGMWVSKWIIASLILNEDIVSNGLNAILSRSSSAQFSRLDAVISNMSIYAKSSYPIAIGLIIIYYIKRLFDSRQLITLDKVKQLIPFILIAIIPIAWFFIASNHSFIHFWFTYRELIIFFFAIFCSLEYVIQKHEVLGIS